MKKLKKMNKKYTLNSRIENNKNLKTKSMKNHVFIGNGKNERQKKQTKKGETNEQMNLLKMDSHFSMCVRGILRFISIE